jgi:alpha-ketoglutarate-dependent taurine dioxygenase
MKPPIHKQAFGTTLTTEKAIKIDVVQIRKQLEEHRYVILKNLALTPETFKIFSDQIGHNFVGYKGGAYVREKIIAKEDTILSVTGGTKMKFAIPMHGEMHYKKIKPALLWFCCNSAPLQNGETTLCDAAELFQTLSLQAQTLFLNNKIKYVRTYESQRWKDIFQTDNLANARDFFKKNHIHFDLDKKETLTTTYTCSALHTDKEGIIHFINNILPVTAQENAGMKGSLVRLEDGRKIPTEILEELYQKSEAIKVNVTWEKGDVLLIDNTRAMHGRNTITCDNRNIMVRMSD